MKNRNMKLNKVLLSFIMALSIGNLNGQSPQRDIYKKVGNFLPITPVNVTADASGNLYAVGLSLANGNPHTDTIWVYKLDKSTNTWKKFSSFDSLQNAVAFRATYSLEPFFLNDTLFIIETNVPNTYSWNIYKDNGSGKLVRILNSKEGIGIYPKTTLKLCERNAGVHVSNNIAYFSGSYYGEGKITNLIRFDGIKVDTLGFRLNTNVMAKGGTFMRNDSIFMYFENDDQKPPIHGHGLFAYDIKKDTFTKLSSVQFESLKFNYAKQIVGDSSRIYFPIQSDFGDDTTPMKIGVNVYRNGLVSDSILADTWPDATIANRAHFYPLVHKNELYAYWDNDNWSYQPELPDFIRIFKVDEGKIKPIIPVPHAIRHFMRARLVSVGDDLYYLPGGKIYVDGDSMNIARLDLNNLECFEYDTLFLRAFHDVNANGVYDAGDLDIQGAFHYGKEVLDFEDSRFYEIVFPDYEENIVNARAKTNCYRLPFDAYLSSDLRAENANSDTLNFPFVFIPGTSDSFRVNFKSTNRARIQEIVTHKITAMAWECSNNSKQVYAQVKLDSGTTLISSTPDADSVVGGRLYYYFDKLTYDSFANIELNLQYSIDDFKIGDIAKHIVSLSQVENGPVVAQDSIWTRIVGSYDPNEKRSMPEGVISKNVDRIRYTIHFQNEGSDFARKVTVVDTIDTRANMLYFTMVDASHPYVASIKNNIVTWEFDDIQLVEKSKDEELSKGYIVFDAFVDLNFSIGDSIRNKADIYFDYNSPITTEYASIYMGENPSNVTNLIVTSQLKMYPNPTKGKLTIENLSKELIRFTVKDATGKTIQIATPSLEPKSTIILDFEDLPKGIYFIQIKEGGASFRVVKQ